MRIGLLVGSVLLITGCASQVARSKVRDQASFDHDCPREQIQVVDEDTNIYGYRLNVCGKPRKYRDFGNSKEWQFVDVTDGVPPSYGTK